MLGVASLHFRRVCEMGNTVWPLLENTISYNDGAFREQGSDNVFLDQSRGKDNTN